LGINVSPLGQAMLRASMRVLILTMSTDRSLT
jgi:hypothetical protein